MDAIAPHCPFVSRSLPSMDISRDAAEELIYRGHHVYDPVVEANGRILFDRGAMVVMETPEGGVAFVFASDPDDMAFDDALLMPDGKGWNGREQCYRFERFDRTQHPEKLKSPYYVGQFLKDDSRTSRMLLVATTPNHTYKQLTKYVLSTFAELHLDDVVDNGINIKENAHKQSTKTIVYTQKARPDGTLDVYAQVAPHRGWSAANMDDQMHPYKKGVLTQMRAAFLRAVFPSVHLGNAADAERAQEIIDRDQNARSALIRRGRNPFAIEKNGTLNLKQRLRYEYTRVAYGLAAIEMDSVKKYVAVPTVIAGVLDSITNYGHFALTTAAITAAIGLGARLASLMWVNANAPFHSEFDDSSVQYWNETNASRSIPNQFGFVNPEFIRRWRVLRRSEMPHLSMDASNGSEKNVISWGLSYAIDPTLSPRGTNITYHKVGQQTVLLAREPNDRSGLTIEYWPHCNASFLHGENLSSHLPETLIQSMRAVPPGGVLMVRRSQDEAGHESLNAYPLTAEEYVHTTAWMRDTPMRTWATQPIHASLVSAASYPSRSITKSGNGTRVESNIGRVGMAVEAVFNTFKPRR